MNTTTFPQKVYPQAEKSDTRLSVSAGIKQLRSYIKDHESLVLIVLAVLLIGGTFLHADLQPRLAAVSGPLPNIAAPKSMEASIPEPSTAALPSAFPPEGISETPAIIATPLTQSSGLVSAGKRNHQLIKRKGVRHHHRR
jgi:hypothetical protein